MMVDVLGAGPRRGDVQIVGLCDLGVGVRGDGKFAGAEFGIGGEFVQAVQRVARHAQDGGAGGGELIGLFGEGMGLQVAAAGEGGRIEIDHHGAFLQRVLEAELEILAAQAAGGGEVGGGVADLERGEGRAGSQSEGRQETDQNLLLHG